MPGSATRANALDHVVVVLPSKKSSWITPRPRTSAVRGWTMSPMPPPWTATSSARCWSLPGSARRVSTAFPLRHGARHPQMGGDVPAKYRLRHTASKRMSVGTVIRLARKERCRHLMLMP